MFYIPFLQAAGAAPSASATGSLIGSFLPIVLIFVVFYFFLIRPQNKKQKETQKMLDALKKGDKIQLVGFGTFEVGERAAREGRNPQTGETMTIAACKAPRFKAGKALKDAINA